MLIGAIITLQLSSIPTIASELYTNKVHEVVFIVDESGNVENASSPEASIDNEHFSENHSFNIAPACINAVSERGFVQVYNHCGWDMRVKVIFAFAGDSACKVVRAHSRTNISPHRGRIDGVREC